MKHLKKLNAKGFAHWVIPALALVIIGGIGAVVMLRSSHAATITATQCKNNGGVWLDLTNNGINHGPCWSTPGAYLVNYGAGKVGDGIDHVPLTGNNPETGTANSQVFNYPNYIIVVSGNWAACGPNACTSSSDPYTHKRSTPYWNPYGGGESYVYGGAYNLCSHDYFWYTRTTRNYSKLCSDTGIYLKRV